MNVTISFFRTSFHLEILYCVGNRIIVSFRPFYCRLFFSPVHHLCNVNGGLNHNNFNFNSTSFVFTGSCSLVVIWNVFTPHQCYIEQSCNAIIFEKYQVQFWMHCVWLVSHDKVANYHQGTRNCDPEGTTKRSFLIEMNVVFLCEFLACHKLQFCWRWTSLVLISPLETVLH